MTGHDPNQDDVLSELKTALEEEPSREFAAGVRARVTQSQVRSRQLWWGLAAAATVTLATVALWRPSAEAPITMTAASPQISLPAVPNRAPETVVAVQRPTPIVTRTAVTTRPAAVLTALVSTDPQLEVITNQPAVLRQLWAGYGTRALQETTVEVSPPTPLTEVTPPAPVAVDPIVVAPIVVSELGVPGGRGGASPVIRRVEATKETR